MNNPFFSIVLPVYNCVEYIQDTFNSIRNQTFRDFELIVVDGGSNDGTLEVINANKDLITYLITEKDKGMYDALNKGFKKAKGLFYCYINADDRLLCNALTDVANVFKTKTVDLVYGNVNYINEEGDIIYTYNAAKLSKKNIWAIRRLPFAQQSAFWAKDIFEKVGGFDDKLKYVADSKFFFQLYEQDVKSFFIAKTLGEYRMRADSYSVGSLDKMKMENALMEKEFRFQPNICKYFIEVYLKLINVRGIVKKKLYKGNKIR